MNNNQFLLALLFLALIITNCNQESFVEEFIPNEGDGTDPEPPAQPPTPLQPQPPAQPPVQPPAQPPGLQFASLQGF